MSNDVQQNEGGDERTDNPFAERAVGKPLVQAASTNSLIGVEQQRAIAEVQARMIVARANPRQPIKAMDLILDDCRRVGLAEVAEYAYARGGSDISGPSIKLAEAIARRWGNIGSGIKEVSRGIDSRGVGYSECVAYAWDLETGYYDERQYQVRHWRDTKQGGYPLKDERDTTELIFNMGQRRKRAVLLTILPDDVVKAARQQCNQTLKAKADTSPEGVQKMLEAFEEFGVSKKQIEVRIQRRLDTIQPAQMIGLKKIYASLRDDMSVPADWFEPEEVGSGQASGEPAKGNAGLRAKVAERKEPQAEKEPTEPKADSKPAAEPEKPAQQQNTAQQPSQGGARRRPGIGGME